MRIFSSMRIFVRPLDPAGQPSESLAEHVCTVLRHSRIFSARPNGIANGCAVVLVNPLDKAAVLASLRNAGLEAFTDHSS